MRTLLFLLTAMLAASPPSDPAGNRIRGEWRGTSKCMNLALAPACKDETTRYVFTGPARGTYRVSADKLVGTKYLWMGDIDLTYDAADSTWSGPLDVWSCKDWRWWFRVRGSRLTGGLTSAAHDTLRAISATRY